LMLSMVSESGSGLRPSALTKRIDTREYDREGLVRHQVVGDQG
jgi:hypothetical protein